MSYGPKPDPRFPKQPEDWVLKKMQEFGEPPDFTPRVLGKFDPCPDQRLLSSPWEKQERILVESRFSSRRRLDDDWVDLGRSVPRFPSLRML